ncbi:putative pectinesterase/pectinesterase inhibitor 36 [Bienertia sinuspersici]
MSPLYFLAFWFLAMATSSAKNDLEMVQMAQTMVLQAKNWAQSSSSDESSLLFGRGHNHNHGKGSNSQHDGLNDKNNTKYESSLLYGRGHGHHGGTTNVFAEDNDINDNNKNYYSQSMAMVDCAKLYDQAEPRLARLLRSDEKYSHEDAVAWLSGVITSHRTCLDGLRERGVNEEVHPLSQNLTMVLNEVLALHAKKQKIGNKPKPKGVAQRRPKGGSGFGGELTSWNPAISRADVVVARDGSGNYRTINEAIRNLLGRMNGNIGKRRMIVYVKAGVYGESVEIPRNLKDVMFVGDGMGKTIVTGRGNVIDGDSTLGSATFRVFGDGFWARDMTFENTAGPQKHQAVALMVASDHSLFYKCSFRGYQDTLYVHSLRQFYRDCHIYGTQDFIFGNAAVVLQNCDIFVRKPMRQQANVITAQGRENPNENTGISIHGSRIRPAPEFVGINQSQKTFLGRPWKKFSRTIVSKTDIGGLIHPSGWTKWEGSFALSTLYYAEYMNTGDGASTRARVNWPGFHVLRDPREVNPFLVRNFIQGHTWIMRTGVPVWLEM